MDELRAVPWNLSFKVVIMRSTHKKMATLCLELVAKQECDAVLASLQRKRDQCKARTPSGEERYAMFMFLWDGHFDEGLDEDDYELRVERPLSSLTSQSKYIQGWTYLKDLKEEAGSYLALSACSRELNATLRVQIRAHIVALFQEIAHMDRKALDPLSFTYLCDFFYGNDGLARFFTDLSTDDLQRLRQCLSQRLNNDIIPD